MKRFINIQFFISHKTDSSVTSTLGCFLHSRAIACNKDLVHSVGTYNTSALIVLSHNDRVVLALIVKKK